MKIMANYKTFPDAVNKILDRGQSIGTEINNTFDLIDDMHSVWQGARYSELCKKFQDLKPVVEDVLRVCAEIAANLDTVYRNYEAADRGTTYSGKAEVTPPSVKDVTVPGEEPLNIDIASVNDYKPKVKSKLGAVNGMLDSIDTIVYDLEWDSPAASNFKGEIRRLKDEMKNSIDEVNGLFDSFSTEAAETFAKAENANNIEQH